MRNEPGDIICYNGHVAMYIGNGKIRPHQVTEEQESKFRQVAIYRRIVV